MPSLPMMELLKSLFYTIHQKNSFISQIKSVNTFDQVYRAMKLKYLQLNFKAVMAYLGFLPLSGCIKK